MLAASSTNATIKLWTGEIFIAKFLAQLSYPIAGRINRTGSSRQRKPKVLRVLILSGDVDFKYFTINRLNKVSISQFSKATNINRQNDIGGAILAFLNQLFRQSFFGKLNVNLYARLLSEFIKHWLNQERLPITVDIHFFSKGD